MNWFPGVATALAILGAVGILADADKCPGYGAAAGGLFVAAGLFFLAGVQWDIAQRFGRPGRDRPDANASAPADHKDDE